MSGGTGALFPDWMPALRDATNRAVDALVTNHGDRLEALSEHLLGLLVALEQALRGIHPWLLIGLVAALALAASRRWGFALLCAAALWLVGALGQWEQAMQTLALVLVSVAVCLLLGLPIGVACGRSRGLRRLVMPLLDLMQTIPSFVYLIPAAMLFGLGKVPAILATVVYALPPLVRLTELGIRQVGPEAIEAAAPSARRVGSCWPRCRSRCRCRRSCRASTRCTMMALAMVVIASMIGARGVGETVLLGLQRNDPGTGLVGGLVIVILAIVLDRMLQAAGRRLQH